MKLYTHQQKLLDLNPRKHLLAWGCGTGKTLTAIELCKKNKVKPLIICPKGLKVQWEIALRENNWIGWVMTKETFRRDYKVALTFSAIIIDEFHFFSNFKSQMSKALAWYIEKNGVKYIWGLTATPYLSKSWNIWTLGRLLGQERGVWNYKAFERTFCFPMRMGLRTIWTDKAGIEGQLAELTKTIGSVVRLEDCVDFPEENEEVEYLQATKAQLKASAVIEANEILALPRITRLHQIAGGTLKDNPYLKDTVFETDKVERMVSFINEHQKSIMVCRYNEEIYMLYNELLKNDVKNIRIINGAVEDKHSVLKDFELKDTAVLLVNASCSEGWESATCSAMLFYSMGWSFKDMVQMRGRIKRINNPRKLFYRYLITKNTPDEDIYENVMVNKRDFQVELYRK